MRCYVPPSAWTADALSPPPEEVHHLRDVLRIRTGDPLIAFDGLGRWAECRVAEVNRRGARLEILQLHHQPPPRPEFVLLQGVPREQKMDWIVQKATELGVRRICPLQTDRAVVRVRGGAEEAKRSRWERIALNAAKQCGANWIPIIDPIRPLLNVLEEMPRPDVLLICSLEPDAEPLRSALVAARETRPSSVGVIIGPEGDFSARERAAARNAGARPVRLTETILRSETAALFVLSVLNYELSASV